AKQHRAGLVLAVRNIRLDHPDQPVAVAQGIVDHRQIARLENIERHLAARQQQRAGQREHRNVLGKLAGSAVFGIDRHLRSRCYDMSFVYLRILTAKPLCTLAEYAIYENRIVDSRLRPSTVASSAPPHASKNCTSCLR